MNLRTLLNLSNCLAIVGLLACAGCVPQEQNAWIYIDNTSGSEMSVTVDSNEIGKVPAASIEKFKVMTGEHRFMVQSGGTIVYNGQHTVAPSNTFLVMQRYILNPDRKGRYATLKVQYGTSFSDRLREISLSQSGNEDALIRSEYSELVKDLKAMPADAWLEIPQGAKVFEPAPERVRARHTSTRLVLNRISDDDYRYLRSAANKTNPTETDLAELWAFAGERFFE